MTERHQAAKKFHHNLEEKRKEKELLPIRAMVARYIAVVILDKKTTA